ncbi:DoxX family protein [Pararhodonellum marinum]|uniref:DoxX family protein n=1 Tax=Pararhodonellum marinum TaxID=2755358 RepID=UPI001890B5B0|nr:DoxX family protein [Pararhodonellum marinum]
MKKKTIAKVLVILLALDLLLSGTLFMFGPNFGVTDFQDIIHRLGFPAYILGAIGFGKILMGLTFLFSGQFRWRTYAYFALLINLFLAIYSHLSAGDGFTEAAPAIVTLVFAGLVYFLDYRTYHP